MGEIKGKERRIEDINENNMREKIAGSKGRKGRTERKRGRGKKEL